MLQSAMMMIGDEVGDEVGATEGVAVMILDWVGADGRNESHQEIKFNII